MAEVTLNCYRLQDGLLPGPAACHPNPDPHLTCLVLNCYSATGIPSPPLMTPPLISPPFLPLPQCEGGSQWWDDLSNPGEETKQVDTGQAMII